jgi:flagellar protein FlaG
MELVSMGFGEISSHVIFFIASLILAVAVVSVIGTHTLGLTQNIKEKGSLLASRYQTDIVIINDPLKISNSIYVKNTGKTALHPELVDVFIDGNYTEPVSRSIEQGGSLWLPGDVLNLTMTSLPSGTHSIMVVTENGVIDVFKYTK